VRKVNLTAPIRVGDVSRPIVCGKTVVAVHETFANRSKLVSKKTNILSTIVRWKLRCCLQSAMARAQQRVPSTTMTPDPATSTHKVTSVAIHVSVFVGVCMC